MTKCSAIRNKELNDAMFIQDNIRYNARFNLQTEIEVQVLIALHVTADLLTQQKITI